MQDNRPQFGMKMHCGLSIGQKYCGYRYRYTHSLTHSLTHSPCVCIMRRGHPYPSIVPSIPCSSNVMAAGRIASMQLAITNFSPSRNRTCSEESVFYPSATSIDDFGCVEPSHHSIYADSSPRLHSTIYLSKERIVAPHNPIWCAAEQL